MGEGFVQATRTTLSHRTSARHVARRSVNVDARVVCHAAVRQTASADATAARSRERRLAATREVAANRQAAIATWKVAA